MQRGLSGSLRLLKVFSCIRQIPKLKLTVTILKVQCCYVAIGNPNLWCRNMKDLLSHLCVSEVYILTYSPLNSTLLCD